MTFPRDPVPGAPIAGTEVADVTPKVLLPRFCIESGFSTEPTASCATAMFVAIGVCGRELTILANGDARQSCPPVSHPVSWPDWPTPGMVLSDLRVSGGVEEIPVEVHVGRAIGQARRHTTATGAPAAGEVSVPVCRM